MFLQKVLNEKENLKNSLLVTVKTTNPEKSSFCQLCLVQRINQSLTCYSYLKILFAEFFFAAGNGGGGGGRGGGGSGAPPTIPPFSTALCMFLEKCSYK